MDVDCCRPEEPGRGPGQGRGEKSYSEIVEGLSLRSGCHFSFRIITMRSLGQSHSALSSGLLDANLEPA